MFLKKKKKLSNFTRKTQPSKNSGLKNDDFLNWKLAEVVTFRNTIIQKFSKLFGLKRDDDFLIVKISKIYYN